MKKVGTRIYFYYGILELLKRRNDNLYQTVMQAREILSRYNSSGFCIKGSLADVPYNIVSIDLKNRKVSFLWYSDFWTSIKPKLLYSIAVNLEKGTYTIVYGKEGEFSWPINYLHRKEMFIEGLEELIFDPYGNGLTLAWNSKRRQDVWIPLPWKVFRILTYTDKNGNITINLGPQYRNRKVELLIRVHL